MMTDPIADMLTRIRNAITAKHTKTVMPFSKVKTEIARILKEEGYINDFRTIESGAKATITVMLRYGPDGERVISGLRRVSRSGCRVYVKKGEIPKVLGGLGISIVSTPKGLMTGANSRKQGLGGEIICNVW